MSVFTENEIEYMNEQRLGRLATVDAEGGHNLAKSKKFRDAGRTGKAAFVVGDVLQPWRARGVEIRGRAEVFSEGGREVVPDFSEELIRIFPQRIFGWVLDFDAFDQNSRSVA